MKRIVNLLSLIAYLFTAVGVDVQIHYCGGEVSQVTLTGAVAECGCEDENDDCCQNEHFHFKNNTEHKGASAQVLPTKASKSVATCSPFIFGIKPVTVTINRPASATGPPGVGKLRRHLVVGRFTC